MKVGEQKGGTCIGYFQRCFINLDNFVRVSFLKKWEREKSTFPSHDQEPVRAAMMRKSTLCLLPVRNSWLLSHSWDRIIKSEKITIALYY